MPWYLEPKKDVNDCEKPRGVVKGPRSVDIRMGKPFKVKALKSLDEDIV